MDHLIIVCDLDGTMCNDSWREHLIPDWDSYHEGIPKDEPYYAVLQLLKSHIASCEAKDWFPPVIFMTGRPEQHRAATTAWLAEVADLHEHDDYWLLMRSAEDYGKNFEAKESMLHRELRPGGYLGFVTDPKKQLLFLEDQDRTTEHFRNLGYTVWQVQARGSRG